MTGRWTCRLAAAAVIVGATLGGIGCGDDDEPERRTFQLEVTKASFPERQHVATPATMTLRVRNPGDEAIPNVAVTVTPDGSGATGSGFSSVISGPNISSGSRPIWILNDEPKGGTASRNTWSSGTLEPGASTTFSWDLTPMRPGSHKLRWTIGGDLSGHARVETKDGRDLTGVLRATIDRTTRQGGLDPDTGKVVYGDR